MPAVARFQFRMDTTANWALANPILLAGEMGIEVTEQNQHLFKIGDGVADASGNVSGTKWLDLPYSSGPQGLPPVHEWNGTTLRFQNPDGSWGDSVNLIGPRGVKGDEGPEGQRGPAGPPYELPPATITKLGGIKVGKNLNITVDGCLSAEDPFYVPIQGIVIFSGKLGGSDGRRPVDCYGKVYEEWVCCDGIATDGVPVPNLKDRFVIGAGQSYSVGTTGGAYSHTHHIFTRNQNLAPDHSIGDSRYTQTVTLYARDMPQHNHNIFMGNGFQQHGWVHIGGQGAAWCDQRYNRVDNWNYASDNDKLITGVTPDPGTQSGWIDRESGYVHRHFLYPQLTTLTNHMPPFYSLIYLMRVK